MPKGSSITLPAIRIAQANTSWLPERFSSRFQAE